jgi:drug/metabolite transporter (DMT)-like permease
MSSAPFDWRGPLLVALGAVCIGFAPIGLRLSEVGPQATAFWRFAFAAPLFLLLILAQRRAPQPISLWALLAGAAFGIDIALWHAALVATSVANATFLVNVGSVASALMAWVILREKPGANWPIAALIALAGAWALSRGAAAGGSGALAGDLLALGAAGFVGLYLVLARKARRETTGLDTAFQATCAACLTAALVCGVSGDAIVPPTLSALFWPAMLAIVASVIGQGMIMAGVGRTPAAVSGILMLIQPVVAAAVAWGMFTEPLSVIQLIGGGLILVGVFVAQMPRRNPRRTPPV